MSCPPYYGVFLHFYWFTYWFMQPYEARVWAVGTKATKCCSVASVTSSSFTCNYGLCHTTSSNPHCTTATDSSLSEPSPNCAYANSNCSSPQFEQSLASTTLCRRHSHHCSKKRQCYKQCKRLVVPAVLCSMLELYKSHCIRGISLQLWWLDWMDWNKLWVSCKKNAVYRIKCIAGQQ